LVLKRPWATYPFLKNQELAMPVYKLIDGEYSNEYVSLDHEYFNLPLRRDLVHNAFIYYRNLGYRTYKTTLTKGTTAGSGVKPRPQKGSGRARMGNKRSPINMKGGKAHGTVPRDFTISMNQKQILKAFKTTLTSLLYESRLVFIDTESLEYAKTKFLSKILKNFETQKLMFVTPMVPCENFMIASKNLPYVKVVNVSEFNVKNAVKSDFVFITKQALEELELIMDSKMMEITRNRRVPRPEFPADKLLGIRAGNKPDFFDEVKIEMEGYEYDPSADTEIYSKSLQGYLEKADEYARRKAEIQDSDEIMFVNKQ
jgi:large subunit ribosomal protein L4